MPQTCWFKRKKVWVGDVSEGRFTFRDFLGLMFRGLTPLYYQKFCWSVLCQIRETLLYLFSSTIILRNIFYFVVFCIALNNILFKSTWIIFQNIVLWIKTRALNQYFGLYDKFLPSCFLYMLFIFIVAASCWNLVIVNSFNVSGTRKILHFNVIFLWNSSLTLWPEKIIKISPVL